MSFARAKRWYTAPLLGLMVAGLLLGCQSFSNALADKENAAQQLPITAEATLTSGEVLDLEVATTRAQKAKGLMYRDPLPDNRGMLFPFEPPIKASFWMKNVPVALDMVFLREGQIVGIERQVPPCKAEPCPTYGPEPLVDQVLELRAGRADELGLEVGNRIQVSFK